jgi:hypothetical protein
MPSWRLAFVRRESGGWGSEDSLVNSAEKLIDLGHERCNQGNYKKHSSNGVSMT